MSLTNGPVNIGYLLNKAARMMRYHLEGKLTLLGITFQQYIVIKDLLRHEESEVNGEALSPCMIANRLDFNRPTITGIIDRLEANGWVTREANPKDRRSQIIRLTQKAREKLPELEACSRETTNDALKGLGYDEVQKLVSYLNSVIENIETSSKDK